MMIPIGIAIYALIVGFSMGVLMGYIIQRPKQPTETLFGHETDSRGAPISHMAPQNFKPLTPALREKLRTAIPEFAEAEDIKLKNFADAERLRRTLGDPALPKPIMAGMEPLS